MAVVVLCAHKVRHDNDYSRYYPDLRENTGLMNVFDRGLFRFRARKQAKIAKIDFKGLGRKKCYITL